MFYGLLNSCYACINSSSYGWYPHTNDIPVGRESLPGVSKIVSGKQRQRDFNR